jgi:hypothetical protein
MVKLLNKTRFIFLLAKRNLFANKKTTSVIIFTLSLIFSMFFLMLGVESIYRDIFSKEAQNAYPNIDLVVSYDEYSSSRLINKRVLSEDYDDINYALAFFNLQIPFENNNRMFYINLLSSLPHEFEIMMDIDVELRPNESIVTKTFAIDNSLEIGDKIELNLFGTTYEYSIADVIDDYGFFKGNSIYVDKEELLEKVYSLSYLSNFGNVVYVSTNNIDKTYEELNQDLNYQDYEISRVVDQVKIQSIINEYISIIRLAGFIVLISLIIVLNSLFSIVIRDIYEEIGVFETLGDNKKMGYFVCLSQWIIYLLTSFIFGYFLALGVANIGANIYGVTEFISIKTFVVLESLAIISIAVLIKNIYLIKKFYKKNSVDKIKDKRFVLANFNYFLLALSSLIMIAVLVFDLFSIKYKSLIVVSLSIYICLSLLLISLKILSKILTKKRTNFALFNSKHLQNNKNIHQSLNVIFVSLIVIAIMLTVRFYISFQIEQIRSYNKIDILMVNIIDYDEELLNEIKTYDVDEVNPGFMYLNIVAQTEENDSFLIKMVSSVDREDFSDFYGYDLGEINPIYENNSHPYILFPENYKLVYGFKEGDIIRLNLEPRLSDVSFVIGGFIKTDFDQFAYTNLTDKIEELSLEYNSLMINSENSEAALNQLIRNYSQDMYYFVDAQAEIELQLDRADSILALFTVLIIFVISSFLLVVFNNTVLKYYSLKNDYAKVKILGIKNSQIINNLFKEIIILFLCLIIVGTLEIILLSNFLKYLLLFFDYYKNLTANIYAVIISYSAILFVLLVSYLFYFLRIRKLEVSNEIRVF